MFILDRSTRKPRQMQLISLVDVLCLLLIFFMLTTSFVHTESMELAIPRTGGESNKTFRQDVMRIFVGDDGKIYLDENEIAKDDLQDTLINAFSKEANRKVVIFSASEVSVQALVSLMDMVYLTGGRNLSVTRWLEPQEVAPSGP